MQDRCGQEIEQEVKEEHEVPMDKVLKVEIYELLHAADCAKVATLSLPVTRNLHTKPVEHLCTLYWREHSACSVLWPAVGACK